MADKEWVPKSHLAFAPTPAFLKYYPEEGEQQAALFQQPSYAVGKMSFAPMPSVIPPPADKAPPEEDKEDFRLPRMPTPSKEPRRPNHPVKLVQQEKPVLDDMPNLVIYGLGGVLILVVGYYAWKWWGASVETA